MKFNTESTTAPSSVVLERLPDGKNRVVLHRNIIESRRKNMETEMESIVYEAEGVEFMLPDDRADETTETIETNFEEWWTYGETDHSSTPTAEERISALEDAFMFLVGGVI